MEMYSEELLFHYKSPRNVGNLDDPTVSVNESNPTCGDEIHLELDIENEKVVNARHKTTGCAICTASMSMLSEKIIGMNIDNVKKMTNEDIFEILGIEVSPGRIKCAILSLISAKKAILIFENNNRL